MPEPPARGVALVTGAAGGLGTAITAALARDGLRVAAVDVAPPAALPAGACYFEADLRHAEQCAGAVAAAVTRLGRLDALVHAAGITRDAVLWKLPPSAWDDVLAVNLTAAFHLSSSAVPHLRRAGGGAIVFLSSIVGERGRRGLAAYAASKAGLHGLTRVLAREVGRFGVRVNAVAPGMIRTALTETLPPEVLATARAESCLGRLGEPEDVAEAVAFLVSSRARHVTGHVLRVDGGQLA